MPNADDVKSISKRRPIKHTRRWGADPHQKTLRLNSTALLAKGKQYLDKKSSLTPSL